MAGRSKKLRPEQNVLLGRRLRLTRRAMNLTQRAFAAQAEVSPESYNQWENGAVYPPPDGAIKLVKAHKLTLDWIYLGAPDMLPSWLAKAIEALGDAEAAIHERAEAAQEQAGEVKIVRPRRSKSAA